MAFFAGLEPGDPAIGGKARSLARLRAAGHETPPGFAVTGELLAALRAGARPLPVALDDQALGALDRARDALMAAAMPEGFEAELVRRLAALGPGPYSVRSSFATEDESAALAAGVFESRLPVAAGGVMRALREVLASAIAPAAIAYFARAGGTASLPGAPMAVLIHAHVGGTSAGTAALDPAGKNATAIVSARAGTPAPACLRRIEEALRDLAGRHGAVEVEWVASGDTPTLLQLRPYRPPAPPAVWSGWRGLDATMRTQWTWDLPHNPLPLSPAQQGLVALVEERGRTGLRQRVFGHYLFMAPDHAQVPRALDPWGARVEFDLLRRRAEIAIEEMGAEPDLEAALAVFVATYETLFGLVGPAVRRGRAALEDFLREHGPQAVARLPVLLSGVCSAASVRREFAASLSAATEADRDMRLGDYLARFGDEAPVWDVAVPTYREARDRLLGLPRGPTGNDGRDAPPGAWQAEAHALLRSLDDERKPAFVDRLGNARAAWALGEDDDALYARVQAAVRRALLAVGRRLAATGAIASATDVFFLPLDLVRKRVSARHPPPADLAALALGGRRAYDEAVRDPPPTPASSGAATDAAFILAGHGTGGRFLGRVATHDPHLAPPPDAVLVAPALLPTELPLVHAGALVVETGGPLDHVSAQARERGLPAVTGVAGACRLLPSGTLVLVDADRGRVIRLQG